MKLGFLLVDVQNDFLHRARLDPDAHILENTLSTLLSAFRHQGLPVFHCYTIIKEDGSDAMPHWQTSSRPMPCIEGSVGARSPQSLHPQASEKIFKKQFYNAFDDINLLPEIQKAGVDTLVIAGIYTHACVRESVLSAYRSGLNVWLPTDGVASYDAAHAKLTLDFLQDRAAVCLTTADIISVIQQQIIPNDFPGKNSNTWLQRNPSNTEEIISEVPLMDASAVNKSIAGVIQAQKTWSKISEPERRSRLLQWTTHLQSSRLFWIESLIQEVGKPRKDAENEVNYGLSLLQYTCDTIIDTYEINDAISSKYVIYHPHGVVGLITPWNNPFAIPLSKIIAALAHGNGVVWKAALHGSRLAQALHQSLIDCGMGHIVALLTGDAETGQALAESDAIQALSFTGSITTGQSLARLCAKTNKPFQAELGGNNSAIILSDINQSAVAQDLAQAMFSFSGQRCTAVRRIIIEQSIFESFKQTLKMAVLSLHVGNPSSPETTVGPVISKDVQSKLLKQIEQAKKEGATILTGGFIPPQVSGNGCWIMPTIMTDLPPESEIIHQELFGPVVALQCAKDIHDAIALSNAVPHGLLAAIYTESAPAKALFLNEVQAGLLVVNHARPAFDNSLPFCGWKASGTGLPEHGQWDKAFFTKPQAVYHKP